MITRRHYKYLSHTILRVYQETSYIEIYFIA